jgi:hypothetical protein
MTRAGQRIAAISPNWIGVAVMDWRAAVGRVDPHFHRFLSIFVYRRRHKNVWLTCSQAKIGDEEVCKRLNLKEY